MPTWLMGLAKTFFSALFGKILEGVRERQRDMDNLAAGANAAQLKGQTDAIERAQDASKTVSDIRAASDDDLDNWLRDPSRYRPGNQ